MKYQRTSIFAPFFCRRPSQSDIWKQPCRLSLNRRNRSYLCFGLRIMLIRLFFGPSVVLNLSLLALSNNFVHILLQSYCFKADNWMFFTVMVAQLSEEYHVHHQKVCYGKPLKTNPITESLAYVLIT